MRWKAGHLGHLGGILENDASAGAAKAVVRTAAQTGSLSSRPTRGMMGGRGLRFLGVSGGFFSDCFWEFLGFFGSF